MSVIIQTETSADFSYPFPHIRDDAPLDDTAQKSQGQPKKKLVQVAYIPAPNALQTPDSTCNTKTALESLAAAVNNTSDPAQTTSGPTAAQKGKQKAANQDNPEEPDLAENEEEVPQDGRTPEEVATEKDVQLLGVERNDLKWGSFSISLFSTVPQIHTSMIESQKNTK